MAFSPRPPHRRPRASSGPGAALAAVLLTAGAALLAGCAAASGPSSGAPKSSGPTATTGGTSPSAPRTAGGSWGTYHADNVRSGVDTSGAAFRPPTGAWVSPQLDGKVYAEPLIWSGLIIVATENDTLYGLRATDGSVAWSTHIGTPVPLSDLPCGNVDPLGITGTPVVDAGTGRVFAVAETMSNGSISHQLVALDPSSGKLLFQESADPPGMTPSTQQERGALAAAGGRVYVAYGGLDGDCGSYHGWVVAAPTSGPGQLLAYQVPTAREGGIWAPPGPSIDGGGHVWVATGNGSSTSSYDEGNSVLELSPTLSLVDSFAPSNWASDNSTDSDLGSTGPMLLPGNLVFQVGKESTGYLLSASHLGGIGGQLYSAGVCFTIGGEAAGPSDVYVACGSGIKDVRVTANPPSFRVAWSGPSGATGPPIVAGGLVWSVGSSQTLYGLDPASGSVVVQQHLAGTPASYSTPAVGSGLLVVGTGRTVQAFTGPASTTARYWLPAGDGGVFNYGAAAFYGSAASTPLAHAVVGMTCSPDGNGYWLVASDGGIFTFGDARFHGSTGGLRLNRPIVGMAATPDGNGYWLVASDGGIFTFGDAPFRGSAGSVPLTRPVVGMAADIVTDGYWLAAADGGVFAYGAPFAGSAGGVPLRAAIVGITGRG